MFKVLIRGRNCQRYIEWCLHSLAMQKQDWWAMVVLDAPEDNSWAKTQKAIAALKLKNKVLLKVNEKHRGLCWNLWHNIPQLSKWTNTEPDDDDIITLLDADDWLARDALATVARVYEAPNTYLTYGSYIKVSKGRRTKISYPYPKGVDVRSYPWRASHLKTFKYSLFKHVPKDCFLHDGKWLEAASDVALMLPLIEIAGLEHCRHVHKLIYYWQDRTPWKTNVRKQKRCEQLVRAKPSQPRMF